AFLTAASNDTFTSYGPVQNPLNFAPLTIDSDVYSFSAQAGDVLGLALTALSGSRPSLSLIGSDGSTLLGNGVTAREANKVIEGVVAPANGTYYARVSGTDLQYSLVALRNASFEVEQNQTLDKAHDISGSGIALGKIGLVSADPIVAETEPNDDGVPLGSLADLALADDLSGSFLPLGGNDYEAVVTGEISAGNDGDWDFFKVIAKPGDTLLIDLRAAPSGVGTLSDPFLRFFDNSGNQIAFNDDGGNGLESRITYTLFTYNGPYYIVADSFGANTGTYEITARLTTTGLEQSLEDDTFAFQTSAGELFTINTHTPADGAFIFNNVLDPRIEIYDPNGTLVASDDNSAPDGRNASLSYASTQTGLYRVKVLTANDSGGEYVLEKEASAFTPTPSRMKVTFCGYDKTEPLA
ncbi:MAG: PPC domain-containing protein, partial [Verrucomicrobiota bacterium]